VHMHAAVMLADVFVRVAGVTDCVLLTLVIYFEF